MIFQGELSAGSLDLILTILRQILASAHRALLPSALTLLGIAALLEFRLHFLWVIADGFINLNKLVGAVAYLVIKVWFFYWMISEILVWTREGLDTFRQWSFAVTGSAAMLTQAFDQPSTIWDMGFHLAAHLKTIFPGDLAAYIVIVFLFLSVAFHILMALAEFEIAAVSGTVLIPFGILTQTDFFFHGVLRWIAASAVRIFLLGILVAITIIVVAQLSQVVPTTGNAALDSRLTLVGIVFVLTVMSWVLPSIGAGMVVGGSSGMGAWHLMGAGLVVLGAATRATGAIRGASAMVRGR